MFGSPSVSYYMWFTLFYTDKTNGKIFLKWYLLFIGTSVKIITGIILAKRIF